MVKRNVVLLLLAVFLLSFIPSHGQKFRRKSKYSSIGIIFGTSNYVGDLDPGQSFISPAVKFTRPHFGLTLTHRMTPRISSRATATFSRIMGDDRTNSTTEGEDIYRYIRNLSFRNDLYEFKIDAMIDLFENRRGLERRAHYTPYALVGFGLFYHNPKAQVDGSWTALRPLGTEGQFLDGGSTYGRVQPVLPFGLGFRYKLGMTFDIAIEMTWHKVFTDYIDDVGGAYADKYDFEPGSLAFMLSDRSLEGGLPDNLPEQIEFYERDGNTYLRGYGDGSSARGDLGNKTDWFITTAIHLTYIFHPKVVCPKFRG